MTHRRNQLDTAWPGRRSIALAVGALIVAATVWWLTVHGPLQAADLEQASPFPGTHTTRAAPAGAASDAGYDSPGPPR
ncbi:MAG TPA: hypothetical protein VF469_33455 [Kofleriaceae bacterium]